MPYHCRQQWTPSMEVLRCHAQCQETQRTFSQPCVSVSTPYILTYRTDPTSRCVGLHSPGLSSFRNVLDSISVSMEKEREALQQEWQTLDRRRKEFDDEQAVVMQVLFPLHAP